MAVTCKKIIDAALARSSFNDQDAASRYEMIDVINGFVKQVYAKAAVVNPFYFGKIATVAYDSVAGNWKLPADCEVVAMIRDSNGQKVKDVPFYDPDTEVAPRVHFLARAYIPVSADFGATPGALSLIYSRRHKELKPKEASDTVGNTLESDWPEEYTQLLELHLARYLAVKDGTRQEEVMAIEMEKADLMTAFLSHVAEQMGTQYVASSSPPPPPPPPVIMPPANAPA